MVASVLYFDVDSTHTDKPQRKPPRLPRGNLAKTLKGLEDYPEIWWFGPDSCAIEVVRLTDSAFRAVT